MMHDGLEHQASQWHSYRCPVCGHTDEVDFHGAGYTVSCSHCSTSLELKSQAPDRAAALVTVARQGSVH